MGPDRFRALFDHAPFCVHEIDTTGRLLSMNPAGLALVGAIDEAAIRGRNYLAFVCPPDRDRIDRLLHQALSGQACMFALRAAGTNQSRHFISCFIPCTDTQGKVDRLLGMSQDISRLEQEGAELRTLNRTYAVLSRCNRSLARAIDEPGLVRNFCHDLIEVGGYGFAWIGGLVGRAPSRVRMLAHAGTAAEGFRTAVLTAANTLNPHSPCRQAMLHGAPVVLRDLAEDANLAPWRIKGRSGGYRSMVALPLLGEQGTAIGNFSIFSTSHDAFTAAELALLAQLAQDLAFGIQTARARTAAAHRKRQLREDADADARRRIAATLHDVVGQSLQTANLGLKRIRAMAAAGTPVPDELLAALVGEVGVAIREVRDLGQALRPLFLERLSLVEAVHLHCNDIAARTGIVIAVDAGGGNLEPEERIKDQCFLGFREALGNAVRHGQARHIQVTLRARPAGHLVLTIQDDGTGFDLGATVARPSGLGLCTICERAESIGGNALIRSSPGQGTRVRISVPLAREPSPCP